MWRHRRLRPRQSAWLVMFRGRATRGSKVSGTGADDTSGCPATGRVRRVRMLCGCRAGLTTTMAAITVAAAIGARARLTRHTQPLLRFAAVIDAREDLD